MYLRSLFAVVCCSFLILSCKKGDNLTLQERLDSGSTPAELLNDYPVDSFYAKEYQGGYIFQLETDGTGMVVSKTDLDTDASWGCAGNDIQGADGITIGTGLTNTDEIMAECGDFTSAAGLCYHWADGPYSDWYLPSEDELERVYIKVHQKGVGEFADNYYWTSSENNGMNTAQHVLFVDGSVSFSTKTNAHYVRAVRNF